MELIYKKISQKGVYIYSFISLSVLLSLICIFFTIGPVTISEQDETSYVNSTRAFVEFNSFKATAMFDEDVSKIMEADWYGPGYPLIFGSLYKIIGHHNKTFIIINLIFLACIVFLIICMPFETIKERIWILSSLLICAPLLYYLFCFMPVILDLLFTTILIFTLFTINKKQNSKNDSEHLYILLYLVFCLIFSLVKKNFLLFSFSILPFAISRNRTIVYFLLITFFFFINSVYSNYFLAAPINYSGLRALTYFMSLKTEEGMGLLVPFLSENTRSLFLMSGNRDIPLPYIPSFLIVISTPFLALYYGIKHNEKILKSLSIISLVSVAVFFIFYLFHYNFIIKITLGLFLISLISLVIISKRTGKNSILVSVPVIFIYFTPATISHVREEFNKKEVNYGIVGDEVYPGIKEKFKPLSEVDIEKVEIITVLLDQNFFNKYQPEIFISSLPFNTVKGNRLRYTINYRDKSFILHGKIKVNYILTIQTEEFDYPVKLITQTEDCCIYEVL